MRSRLAQGGILLAVLALLGVALAGLLSGPSGGENRVYELEQRLRCPVCQSVSIADSPSDTAKAMRTVVAEQVAAGRTDQQIINYFRARYGEWVLLDPPVAGTTVLLWVLPLAGLAIGGAVLLVIMRRRRPPETGDQLTAEQREHLDGALRRARATASEEGT